MKQRSFSHQHLGGSPVLAWRRQQHRRSARSTLPPLEHNASPLTSKQRHASLPRNFVVVPPVGTSKMLWGGVQQGPALRPSGLPSVLPVKEGLRPEESAMALDLMSSREELCQKSTQKASNEDLKQESDQWFLCSDLESQVAKWREQVPAPKPVISGLHFEDAYSEFVRSLEVEEFSADADDHEFLTSNVPIRVRPGDALVYQQKRADAKECSADADDDEITEDDMAILTAEEAVDAGLQKFLFQGVTEDNIEWENEEEV